VDNEEQLVMILLQVQVHIQVSVTNDTVCVHVVEEPDAEVRAVDQLKHCLLRKRVKDVKLKLVCHRVGDQEFGYLESDYSRVAKLLVLGERDRLW